MCCFRDSCGSKHSFKNKHRKIGNVDEKQQCALRHGDTWVLGGSRSLTWKPPAHGGPTPQGDEGTAPSTGCALGAGLYPLTSTFYMRGTQPGAGKPHLLFKWPDRWEKQELPVPRPQTPNVSPKPRHPRREGARDGRDGDRGARKSGTAADQSTWAMFKSRGPATSTHRGPVSPAMSPVGDRARRSMWKNPSSQVKKG